MHVHLTRLLLTVAVLAGLALVGCSPATTRAAAQVNPSTTPAERQEKLELFYVLPEGLDKPHKDLIWKQLEQSILHGESGDVIHVVRAPDHKLLFSFRLTGEGRSRLKDERLLQGVKVVRAFCNDLSEVHNDYRLQLNLPTLLETFNGLAQTKNRARIVLVGDLLFHSPDELQWSFRKGWPSYSAISHAESTLPHKNFARRRLIPETVEISWAATDLTELNPLRSRYLIDWYRTLFKSEIGGRLNIITPNLNLVFDRQVNDTFSPLVDHADPLPPRMIDIGPEDARIAKLAEISRRFPGLILHPVWAQDADVDLLAIRIDFPNPVFFQHKSEPFAELSTDKRTRQAETPELTKLTTDIEYLRLMPGYENQQTTVYTSLYESRSPTVDVIVRIFKDGNLLGAIPIPFRGRGDRGSEFATRDQSQFWRKLDLGPYLK